MHAAVLLLVALSASSPGTPAPVPPQSDSTPPPGAVASLPAQSAKSQTVSGTPDTNAAAPASEQNPPAPNAGQGHPPISVAATAHVARALVQVTLDAESAPADFQAGLLSNPQNPDQRIVPTITVLTDLVGKKGSVGLDIEVSGLVSFGELTVPLMYKGRQVETLRFHKAGLIVRVPSDGPIVAHQQDGRLLLVLENPTVDDHTGIGARVRFQDADICDTSSDQRTARPAPTAQAEWWDVFAASSNIDCPTDASWSTFDIRPSSQVSLWVPMRDEWFKDRLSGLARSANRRGVLTLRYFSGGSVRAEQNVPIEVRFEPTTANLWWSIGWVGFLLLVGAALFLLLRVSIPNYRRKKAIKDALNEARANTGGISNAIDSQLRVLLRVERLTLDQRRREGWVLLPGFVELATRIEASLNTLTRRIDFTRRLDAATCRRESLVGGPVAPTRLDTIDRELTAACEALKNDQLRDVDWLFVQQRLESADKLINEPSPVEKEAFEALLSQRWQSVRDYFGQRQVQDEGTDGLLELRIPGELESMRACFPRAIMLPRAGDNDGRKWIGSIGVVRSDLQITALELLKDVQFLAPNPPSPPWIEAMERLTKWLATPSIDNLASARRTVERLSEPATVEEIVGALQQGYAEIDMDPQAVAPNQKVKLSVRFFDPRLNAANLRDAVECEWSFEDGDSPAAAQGRGRMARAVASVVTSVRGQGVTAVAQRERGWVVYRYFAPDVAQQRLTVRFLHDGRDLNVPPDIVAKQYQKTVEPSERSYNRKEGHEKWLRLGFQTVQMLAALLVPLATLAITTAGDGTSGRWWDLVAIGFGSEAIRNILAGEQSTPTNG